MKRTTGAITIGLLAIMIMPLLYVPTVVRADFQCGPDDSPEYCQQQADAAAEKAKADATAAAEKAAAIRNASGQGFKLPLNFLTLTTKDSKGNKVTQGQSIFANKDYPVEKYGVLLGTFLRIIDILVYVIGSLALLTLIVAGIMMIANHGDEGWVTKGKGMMLYSILGVIFALLSFIFVNIVTSLLS